MSKTCMNILIAWAMCAMNVQAAPVQQEKRPPLVQAVETIGFTVSDMNLALDFYTRLLGFEKVDETEVWGEEYEELMGLFGLRMRIAKLKLGNQYLELKEYLTPRGRPMPIDSRNHDHWFQSVGIVVSDMSQAYRLLHDSDVQHISNAPQTFPAQHPEEGGIQAFFFEDPDGHPLELIYFPEEKREEYWKRQGKNKLFLGIDHTAIVVDDTEASLKFYRDTLGMDVVRQWENQGPEFAHLVGIKGAKVVLTRLQAPVGPAIVLIDYLAPEGGRRIPADTRTNDLWDWQIRVRVGNVEKAEDLIRKKGYFFVSTGIPVIRNAVLGFQKGFIADDSDGHTLLVVGDPGPS